MRFNSQVSMRVLLLLVLFLPVRGAGAALSAPRPDHDRAFWRNIQKNHYAVPAGESAAELAHELSSYLGSPDPELRDDLTYSILDTWILEHPQLSREELVPFVEEWSANLKSGLGETGTDSVLKRSFSALCLASLAERDLKTPFLGAERYHALLRDAVAYLNAERDLRGYDANRGWIHATAHTADLLAGLSRNDLLTREEQHAVLDAIAERLATAPAIYSYGEQDRLAAAVAVILQRSDFDADYFADWLKRLNEADRKVWRVKPLTPETLATYENRTYMLEALVARLTGHTLSTSGSAALNSVIALIRER